MKMKRRGNIEKGEAVGKRINLNKGDGKNEMKNINMNEIPKQNGCSLISSGT
jgi:hypothetical protein